VEDLYETVSTIGRGSGELLAHPFFLEAERNR